MKWIIWILVAVPLYGQTIRPSKVATPNINNVLFVDGVKYTTITAATAGCQAYTGSAGNSCVIIVPPGIACGEPSPLPDNILLVDYRNCAQSQGLRFNLSAAVTGNVRSKIFLQDNYNASTIGLGPSKSAVSWYSNSYVDQPEVTNGTIAAFNGTMNINSQQANMTSGALVGLEGSGQAGATNGSPFSVADIRGLTANTFIGGNTSATRMVGVYGQKCTSTSSGTVASCFGGYFELPTAASTINRAGNFEGETSFGGTGATPRVVIDRNSQGMVQTTAVTFASLPACGSAYEGSLKAVTDSSTVTWGATITGSSTNHVLAYCDGTNWTVAGK